MSAAGVLLQVWEAINASPLKCPDAIKMGLIDSGMYRDEVIHALTARTAIGAPQPPESSAQPQKALDLPRVGIKRYIAHQERDKVRPLPEESLHVAMSGLCRSS